MIGRLSAVASVIVGGVVGAIAHEASHMLIPAAYGADIGMAWRGGGPSVVVRATQDIPDWAHAATAMSPVTLLVGYAVLAVFGVVPRRPWAADSAADGAALAFLIVAVPSPDDLRQVAIAFA